ncbi:MAG: NTP transferase domain-containing protein [Actinomycetota bacterium]|nr:NTP transferase domain-containing protein [Actinomycetota bacterium]
MTIDALVMAGGKVKGEGPLAGLVKGMIQVGGEPMVSRVIAALASSPSIGRIAVVVPPGTQGGGWSKGADMVLYSDGSITENIYAGLEGLGPAGGLLLIVSADLPLLSADAVEEFLRACKERPADFHYPITSKEEMDKKFFGTARTYGRLKEGLFTGGNIGLIDSKVFIENREIFERLYSLRKSPLKLANLLGPLFIIKFLSGRASIAEAEKRFSSILKARGAAIWAAPEISIDVDKEADLEFVEKILGERKGAA